MFHSSFRFLFLMALLACSSAENKRKAPAESVDLPPSRPLTDVKVMIRQEENGVIFLRGHAQSCFVSWLFHGDTGTIQMRNYQCMRPLNDATLIMKEMVARLQKWTGDPLALNVFQSSVRNLPDIEERIALHAYESEEWNSSTGTPQDEGVTAEQYIQDYANSVNAYAEITNVFSHHCYDIHLEKAQDVSAFEARGLPYYPTLRLKKVRRQAKLPANYFMEFSIKAKHDRCFAD